MVESPSSGARDAARVGGPALIVVGFIFFLSAAMSLGQSRMGPPDNFWMAFVGIPMMGLGAAVTKWAYVGPAARYVAEETAPAVAIAASAVGRGLHARTCPHCRAQQEMAAKFCDECGKPMGRECASCRSPNDADARFCAGCGRAFA